MKLNVGLFALIFCSLLSFMSCSSDDEKVTGIVPDKQVIDAFKKQFPDATQVNWNTRNGYSVASFRLAQNPTGPTNEAWYEGNGECALAELELPSFDLLPQPVKTAYEKTIYASEGWSIDDIDALYRQGMALVYKIEVEKAGQPDHDLLFSADGILISDKIDADNDDDNVPVTIPSAILDFVNKYAHGAVIFDLDKEDGNWELDIQYQNKEYELYFNASFKFIQAEQEDFPMADLPQAVKDALAAYGSQWEIDSITLVISADKSVFYKIELENTTTDQEKTLTFNTDGTLIP